VRTDSKATTLDKFLTGSVSMIKKQETGVPPSAVVPMQLYSVKKLIHEFEADVDPSIAATFKNHTYVGLLSSD